ncbi:arf-GAP with coiled-coil, ANK repeat and PH domain-containing 2 [Paramuricea clavata]|uniref:Arf-GAP with coiled-coil, ANK repeat and PH domain-containing 2 n=1 Tax=Paramuricea clavata TaxID=317549 RepID=A0A6S7H527_PARCT|nr:arf-GAP with coiled-coil, ANK repeat and PH domain-containing 2 [Paramuricea clavata]
MLLFVKILMDQTQCSIANALQKFLKEEIKKVKETKKIFDKMGYDLSNALVRNSQLPKSSKTTETEEVKNIVTATKVGFDHLSLDYTFQINVLQSRKRFEILDVMLAYMHAQYTFFHQGFNLLKEIEPQMRSLGKQLEDLSVSFVAEKKEMEGRHQLVQGREDSLFATINPVPSSNEVVLEGYLFKRSKNAFKTWQRRYFTMQNNKLFYQHKFKDGKTVLAEDLRLCKIREAEDIDRRFCFELIFPTKLVILQADSKNLQDTWENAMKVSIDHAFGLPYLDINDEEESQISNSTFMSIPVTKSRSLESLDKLAMLNAEKEIKDISGNDQCAECGKQDPKWASINLGLVLCIECSGIHRSLGVHVSKVRSLHLDDWEPESIKVMKELGNQAVNRILESRTDAAVHKPSHDSKREIKEEWIKGKYVEKIYFCGRKCIEKIIPLDENILRALNKVPGHHVRDVKRPTKKKLGRRRPNLTSSIFKRFSKSEKKNCEALKEKPREEKAARNSATTSPELSPEIKRSVPPLVLMSPTKSRSPQESSDESGVPSKEDESEVGTAPCPPSPRKINENILKAQLVAIDRNSIGSCYDNVLHREDADSDGSVEETDLVDDCHDSDVEQSEVTVKEIKVIEGLAEEESVECRAREKLKNIPANLLLYKATDWKNLPLMLLALTAGAKINWQNDEDELKTSLHQSVEAGFLAGTEFLLQNGAKINLRDSRGRAALHHAALLGQTGEACLLLKKGANQHAVDENGQDPLMIALSQMHADIVTLLRLSRLNDEMKESSDNTEKLGDNTFTDVVRDFSNIASLNPERLQRKYDPDRHTNV